MKNATTKLSNVDLLSELRKLVSHERNVLTEVLWHLKEVEKRRLFADEGYPSLFEYAVKGLGYSESAAFRRISAMRLLKSLSAPEVEKVESLIQSGVLNLSKLTMAQEHFKYLKKKGEMVDSIKKEKILADLQLKSTRECEKYFVALAPEAKSRERIRALTETESEIRIIVSNELLKKIEQFKNLQSHVKYDASLAEVLEMALDVAIQKKDPRKIAVFPKNKKIRSMLKEKTVEQLPSRSKESIKDNLNPRFIPASTRRFIWTRDQGRCTFKNKETGQMCGSTYQIQIDHIHPVSLNGDADPKNLRLLCRTHNAHQARKIFGVQLFRGS